MQLKHQHLIETAIDSKKTYSGSFLNIIEDTVKLPNSSKISTREYIDHSGASAIIAINDKDEVAVIHQYRHSVGQVLLEIPAGRIDGGENHLTTAKRELLEETGIEAKQFTLLGSVLPCIGYSNEIIHYYLAKELSFGQPKLDEDELLELSFIPMEELLYLAFTNQLQDGKTLSGLMLYLGKHLRP